MNLARPATTAPFVKAQPLPAATGPAPDAPMLDWKDEPADTDGLVTVRYHGHEVDKHGSFATRFSVRNDTREPWYRVTGSLDDAVQAARKLAVSEGDTEDPAAGRFARTSVAVLGAGQGVWHLSQLHYYEGMGDGMDAIISMPIDRVPESGSQVSVPYGAYGARGFDTPDKVMVRFDDPRVAAVVGVDSVAFAPKG
ncbi:MAG: hypothetical protein KDC46_01970 [Thermoleophilia bacterium]|nr:hypothetical protein [Thermoleophilia bacterium]